MSAHPLTLGTRAERFGLASLGWFAFFAMVSIVLQNLVFLAVGAWVVWMAQKGEWQLPATPLNAPLLLFSGILVLASLAEGTLNGSFFGLRKVLLVVVFFVTVRLVREPLRAERLINLFLFGAIVCSLWALLAHGLQLDEGRAKSFSGHYMTAGGMFMLGFILAFTRCLDTRGSIRWAWLAGCVSLGLALLFTYTRSSWIGAALAILFIGWARDWRIALAAILVPVTLLVVFPHSRFTERALSVVELHHKTNIERTYMWESGWQLINERPLLGYGVDNLAKYYPKVLNPKAVEIDPPHVHDTLLQLAINGGVLAPVLYLWWVFAAIGLGWRTFTRHRSRAPSQAGMALALAAGMLAFFANGWFEFNVGTAQVMTIIYFLSGLLPALASDRGPAAVVLRGAPRLLFLRPRFRGDVLLASPIPRLIKAAFPDAKVDLLVEPAQKETAQAEPAWDQVLEMPRKGWFNWWKAIRAIRGQGYDAVCDLFGNPRTALVALLSGAGLKLGPEVRVWGAVFHLKTQPDRPGRRPAAEAYYDLLRLFGLTHFYLQPRWVLDRRGQASMGRKLKALKLTPGKLLGLFPGASHPAKRWSLERFIELARQAQRRLRLTPCFVLGPAEKTMEAAIRAGLPKGAVVLTGLSGQELAALWSACAVVVANDAFPMHLGPAVGTPTVGLFGPGDPEIWFPYTTQAGHEALHFPAVCWPCHRDVCEDTKCWDPITVTAVLDAVRARARKT